MNNKSDLRSMILVGIFAALMVVGAKLSIPTPFPVPLTFQLFFAVYAGLLLGAKNGFASQLIYIALGLVGLPVFSAGGGFNYIFKATFGYIIGFAVAAFVIGYLVQGLREIKLVKMMTIGLVGYFCIYIIGNVYFYFLQNLYWNKPIGLYTIFEIMLPYMVKDLILLFLAAYSSTYIIPILRKAGYAKVQA